MKHTCAPNVVLLKGEVLAISTGHNTNGDDHYNGINPIVDNLCIPDPQSAMLSRTIRQCEKLQVVNQENLLMFGYSNEVLCPEMTGFGEESPYVDGMFAQWDENGFVFKLTNTQLLPKMRTFVENLQNGTVMFGGLIFGNPFYNSMTGITLADSSKLCKEHINKFQDKLQQLAEPALVPTSGSWRISAGEYFKE